MQHVDAAPLPERNELAIIQQNSLHLFETSLISFRKDFVELSHAALQKILTYFHGGLGFCLNVHVVKILAGAVRQWNYETFRVRQRWPDSRFVVQKPLDVA